MKDLENELRKLRDDVDGLVRPTTEGAERVLRRARRHRIANAAAALVAISAMVVAAIASASAISSRASEDDRKVIAPATSDTGPVPESDEQEVRFSFLLGSPCYSLILPDDFNELPELSSPISDRSFDFIPTENDFDRIEPIDTIQGRDGREVDVAVMTEDPPQWSLRWQLDDGALYTHVRGADGGLQHAEVVASHISIHDSACGAGPEVEAHPPLESSVSKPPYNNYAAFRSAERAEWTVGIESPSRLPPGETRAMPGDFGGYIAEKGTDFGLLVTVYVATNEADARALLEMVSESLQER